MAVKIEFPVSFKMFVRGHNYINSSPGKLVDILAKIQKIYPDISKKMFRCDGKLKSFIILFINNKIIKKNEIEKIVVEEGQVIKIVVAIGGG